jgi:hypothetical protein
MKNVFVDTSYDRFYVKSLRASDFKKLEFIICPGFEARTFVKYIHASEVRRCNDDAGFMFYEQFRFYFIRKGI